MISASHRKRDSREALVRWLRDRSSGGRTSHSGTFDCRFPILDCTPFPRFSIESRQSKSPKILAGNIFQCFSVAGARPGLNRIRLQLAIYFCLYRRSLPENTAGGRTRFRGEILAQKFRKKLYVRLSPAQCGRRSMKSCEPRRWLHRGPQTQTATRSAYRGLSSLIIMNSSSSGCPLPT